MIDFYFILAFINDYFTEFHAMEAYSTTKLVNCAFNRLSIIVNFDLSAYCSYVH